MCPSLILVFVHLRLRLFCIVSCASTFVCGAHAMSFASTLVCGADAKFVRCFQLHVSCTCKGADAISYVLFNNSIYFCIYFIVLHLYSIYIICLQDIHTFEVEVRRSRFRFIWLYHRHILAFSCVIQRLFSYHNHG